MTQHVGFYEVISDSFVTLAQPAGDPDQSFTFTPPANAATDNRAVLTFMVAVTNAVDLKFRVDLNNVNIVALNENGHYRGFVQEVINNVTIKPGQPNTLLCHIVGGKGTVAFSDMVILYQRNI